MRAWLQVSHICGILSSFSYYTMRGNGCAPPGGLEGFAWPFAAGLALEAALELAGVFVGEGD